MIRMHLEREELEQKALCSPRLPSSRCLDDGASFFPRWKVAWRTCVDRMRKNLDLEENKNKFLEIYFVHFLIIHCFDWSGNYFHFVEIK